MAHKAKEVLEAAVRFFLKRTSRDLRKTIYSIPFAGRFLQNAAKNILNVILYQEDFLWFQFKFGLRSGFKMRVKLPEESEFYLETHDPDVADLLSKFIMPGFTVFDIGAHIGYFTLPISRLAGPQGKVFAFEPLPKNARRLEEHVFCNHCHQNTKILQVALAAGDAKAKFLDFKFSTLGRLSSAVSANQEKPLDLLTVECRSLDSLLKESSIQPPDFVKIDVEGSEFEVLQGMRNLLKEVKPKLLIEIHSDEIGRKAVNFLKAEGYSAYINGRALLPGAMLMGAHILFMHSCSRLRNRL